MPLRLFRLRSAAARGAGVDRPLRATQAVVPPPTSAVARGTLERIDAAGKNVDAA